MEKNGFLTFILELAFVVVISFLIIHYVGQRTVVNGESMESTLHDGESLILDKISYRFSDPKRYDIVVFPVIEEESGEEVLYIKRVIGLPGETVSIKDGCVYIDGEQLSSDVYAKEGNTEPGDDEYNNITLGKDEYYCLGDNRNVSKDSRYIGPVSKSRFDGKICLRIYPLNKFGKIDK